MTVAASKHIRRSALRHDLRHRAMSARMPIGRVEKISNLRRRERCLTIRNVSRTHIGRFGRGGGLLTRVNGKSPIRRWLTPGRRFLPCDLFLGLDILRPGRYQQRTKDCSQKISRGDGSIHGNSVSHPRTFIYGGVAIYELPGTSCHGCVLAHSSAEAAACYAPLTWSHSPNSHRQSIA